VSLILKGLCLGTTRACKQGGLPQEQYVSVFMKGSTKDNKFVRVKSGWVSTSAFISLEITSLRLACKRNSDIYYSASIISERLGLENREWSLDLEAVPDVVLDRMMPARG